MLEKNLLRVASRFRFTDVGQQLMINANIAKKNLVFLYKRVEITSKL